MGYKEDKELYERYQEALINLDASFQKRMEKVGEIFGEDVKGEHIDSAFEYIAKTEYIELILKRKAEFASRYAEIHATEIESENKDNGTENERKDKIIDLMNGMVDFFNSIHDNSNPILSHECKDVLVMNSMAPSAPKNFAQKTGTIFELDDTNNFSISNYEKRDRFMLKCGNMAITVSQDLVDIQFGDKEGIIVSKDSSDCKYYKLPENRHMLLENMNYQLNPEWYTEDLTDELTLKNCDITSIISSGILHIKSKSLREEILQNANILLTKAKVPTITDISQEGILKIMEKAKGYHDQKESEIEKLKSDKTKSENEMQKEIERLKKQNSELQETLQEERTAWRNMPIIGKIIAKRIELKKKSLPNGEESIANLPDTFEEIKYDGIDFSKVNETQKMKKLKSQE